MLEQIVPHLTLGSEIRLGSSICSSKSEVADRVACSSVIAKPDDLVLQQLVLAHDESIEESPRILLGVSLSF